MPLALARYRRTLAMAVKPDSSSPSWSTGANRQPRRRNAILRALRAGYPGAGLLLRFESPYQLLCAAVLAAQTTDERVNAVTPALFARWPDADALATAEETAVAQVIGSVNYYRTKAARLVGLGRSIATEHGGRVPDSIAALVGLPGVGRKTATLVVNHGFGRNAGVVVDTHVARISMRLDWSHEADPARMADELESLVPRREWRGFGDLLAAHGRACCRARRPDCPACPVAGRCYWPGKTA